MTDGLRKGCADIQAKREKGYMRQSIRKITWEFSYHGLEDGDYGQSVTVFVSEFQSKIDN